MNKGFGNSGGCGSGPAVFGWRRYAISQHDTAIATATSAKSAVIINAMIKPTIETQISSTLCAEGAEMYGKDDLLPFIIIDYIVIISLRMLCLTFSWICCIPLLSSFQSEY